VRKSGVTLMRGRMAYQSCLVILVPEADPLVGPFRSKYDSSAADGMPPHITINYPFLALEEDRSGAISALKDLFSGHPRFTCSLEAVARFPGVMYLEPFPRQSFADLIQAVALRFPQSPPYGGVYGDIVPHLTVATAGDEATIEEIAQQFAGACTGKLPIRAAVNEIWLMDNQSGFWTRRESFVLAGMRPLQ
jgi:2'-5' RNA ligase